MNALSDRKIEIVRTLVEAAPDKVVGGLQQALSKSANDSGLAAVRQLVEAEAANRALRNLVLQAVAPLCVGDGTDSRSLVFPARVLACIWRGLKALAPQEMAAAAKVEALIEATPTDQRPPDPSTTFDRLAHFAANALRTSQLRDFRLAADACDLVHPGGAEMLASCLELAPVLRRASARLPEWVAQPGDETAAAARLAYKDAVAVSDDAGPRFFEMLAGQMTPSWQVLRVISAVMDKPTERYLADSELGGFPERVMNDIDASLAAIGALDPNGGAAAGRAAAKLAELITEQATELEMCIELTRESGWGQRIFNQKQSLASVAERHLREAEKLAMAALPTEGGGRARKPVPRLSGPPDAAAVTRAMTFLTFCKDVRSCANYAGFSAAHAKMIEKLGQAIDHYVEDVLDFVRTGDAECMASAHAHLKIAADFCQLVRDTKAADLIRRRAASACHEPAAAPLRAKA